VHHLPDCDPMLTEILRKAMLFRHRLNVSPLSLLLLGNDGLIVPLEDSRVMKNEKLRSTTVRFTESDRYLIRRLQKKLGIDMFRVIRHLAENENLLSSSSVPKKR
jgi:hypothetical protein